MTTSLVPKIGAVGSLAQYQQDASGNVTGLVGPGGIIDDLNLKPLATLDGRFLAGQPIGITRPVRNTGKLVCRFKSTEWTPYGAASLADVTGYDANGNVTGVVSRTGHPTLMKVTPGDDSNEGANCTTPASTVVNASLNGLFGLWVYVETQPGYQAGGTTIYGSLAVEVSTDGGFTNHLTVNFAPNCIKEGWNFLVFRMRNFQAYVTGSGVTETHPHGVLATSNGTGAGANILANPINKLRVIYNGTGITGTNFYLDSLWTGFDVQAQMVMGFDAVDDNLITYGLPLFQQYGWKSYFTINGAYWDGVTSRILADYSTIASGAALTRYNTLKAAGWDAINHGLQHLPGSAGSPTMAQLTDAAEIAYEVMANYGIMRSLGLTKGSEFYAAPQNSSSRLTEKVIAGCGFKAQRAARGKYNFVTPWGLPNPNFIGALELGGTGEAVYTATTGNVTADESFGAGGIGNLQRAYNAIDLTIDYGATLFTYTHGLQTTGDDGTGNLAPTVASDCMESLHSKFCARVKAKEDAGLIRVRDGFTGFYYGVGR